MDRLLAKRAIYKHDPPPEGPDTFKSYVDKHAPFRPCFRDEEEFEYFCMLPLDPNMKMQIIKRIMQDQEMLREVLECEGREGSSRDHRQMCVACVCTERPPISAPYY